MNADEEHNGVFRNQTNKELRSVVKQDRGVLIQRQGVGRSRIHSGPLAVTLSLELLSSYVYLPNYELHLS